MAETLRLLEWDWLGRTQRTVVSGRDGSLAFHYRKADADGVAKIVALANAALARSESPSPEGLHWHDVPGVGALWWDAAGKIVGGPEDG